MIEHEASGASGSAERSGVGQVPRAAKRQWRTFGLGCLAVALVVGVVFRRPLAVFWCWGNASVRTTPESLAWNCAALSDLGPASLTALMRLLESPELQRSWSAGRGIHLLHRDHPEANAPVHDLLLSPSPRVRAVVGMVLVSSEKHDASGLPAVLEGLASSDADARFFSALSLTYFPGDRFEKEVPDAPRKFVLMVQALAEGLKDPRTLFVHEGRSGFAIYGETKAMGQVARDGLMRLDPGFGDRGVLEGAMTGEPKAAFEEARTRAGPFFTGSR